MERLFLRHSSLISAAFKGNPHRQRVNSAFRESVQSLDSFSGYSASLRPFRVLGRFALKFRASLQVRGQVQGLVSFFGAPISLRGLLSGLISPARYSLAYRITRGIHSGRFCVSWSFLLPRTLQEAIEAFNSTAGHRTNSRVTERARPALRDLSKPPTALFRLFKARRTIEAPTPSPDWPIERVLSVRTS